VTLEKPTKSMQNEGIDAGYFKSKMTGREFKRIQSLTIEGLLSSKERILPCDN
jgi:hypothetical protein